MNLLSKKLSAQLRASAQAPRTPPKNRMNRLRVSWFCLGVASSLALQILPNISFSLPSLSLPDMAWPEAASLKEEATEQALALPEADKKIAAVVTPKKAPAPIITYPLKLELEVARGDTLSGVLNEQHLSNSEVNNAITALRQVYNPKDVGAGDTLSLALDKKANESFPHITSMQMKDGGLHEIMVKREGEKLVASKKVIPTKTVVAHAGGVISNSLYQTATDAGLPSSMLAPLIQAYSYDIDFQRDIRSGDSFDVLFEREQTAEGRAVKYGHILYAALKLRGRTVELYNYQHKDGSYAYYNAKGESVKKALLRTPVNGVQITSGFGMRRHPILGYSKMHKGVDFGAATGTPIYASGDGVISEAGPKGAYGNFVEIKHNAKYSTAYAHMSRFGKGIRAGTRVKQGQVIGYVGTTGRSTGPHLHYELRVAGVQVNPSKIALKTGNTLEGRELAAFKKMKSQLSTQLASIPKLSTQEASLSKFKQ